MKNIKYFFLINLLLSSTASLAQYKEILDAVQNGHTDLNMRYRYEFVHQDNLHNANASTLRTALKFNTSELKKNQAIIEFENIAEIGSRRYNDTVNGKTNYAVVKDPKTTEINQLYIQSALAFNSKVKIGRQELIFNNGRFIGNSPWRQNHRSLDGISLENKYFTDFEFQYAFIRQVNRNSGKESVIGKFSDSNINLLNITYKVKKNLKLSLYNFLLDIPDPANITGTYAVKDSSSVKTSGLRINHSYPIKKRIKLNNNFEYAYQTSFANNPIKYDADYILIEPELNINDSYYIKFGYEKLGSNGNYAILNTLGNKHGFNGFADQFLAIPSQGLQDFYAKFSFKSNQEKPLNLYFAYHDFYAARNSSHYGHEFDFLISKDLNKYQNIGIKATYYKAASLNTDTQKIMLVSTLNFNKKTKG